MNDVVNTNICSFVDFRNERLKIKLDISKPKINPYFKINCLGLFIEPKVKITNLFEQLKELK